MSEDDPSAKPGREQSSGKAKKPRDPSLPPRITRGGDRRGRKRQSLSPSRPLKGMQSERAPDYLVVGQIVCDIQPDGSGVLGGTALYSALTAARLGARVGVLTRGRYGERIDGIDVPSLEPFSDQLTIITQGADTPTFFVNEYLGSRRTQTIRKWAGADRSARSAAALGEREGHPPRSGGTGDRPPSGVVARPRLPGDHAARMDAGVADGARRARASHARCACHRSCWPVPIPSSSPTRRSRRHGQPWNGSGRDASGW